MLKHNKEVITFLVVVLIKKDNERDRKDKNIKGQLSIKKYIHILYIYDIYQRYKYK